MSWPLLLAFLALPQAGSNGPESVPLKGRPDGAVADLLQRARDRRAEPEQRREALEDLIELGRPLDLAEVRRLRPLVGADWLAEYARALALCGEPALADLGELFERHDPRLQAEAGYALAVLDAAGGEAFARARLADRSQPDAVRVAALRALDARRSVFARVEALRRLEQEDGAVLLECLAVLRRHPEPQDLPYLIDLLHRRQGRAANEAVALLRQLTGYRFGRDPDAWRRALLRHRAEGTPFRAPTAALPASGEETVSYLGLPILGERVVFVLDASGSMDDALPEQPRLSKGARAVEELIRLLPRLPAGASFGLVFFADEASSYGDRLREADEDAVWLASSWLRGRTFFGGTNLWGGLQRAFERDEADEIVLLSDGEPTVGELTDPRRILLRARAWNRWRNLRISAISFGAPHAARDFLCRLARENDGGCLVID